MKIGIIGLPQTGKKTLFELLTGQKLSGEAYSAGKEVRFGTARIRDARFDKLVEMYNPQKSVPATIEVVLLPKFDKEAVLSGEFLKSLDKCDALCHIVRAFSDESVFHSEGSVDPLRDIENVYSELILSDLILAEKRIERINLDRKKGVAGTETDKEKEVILKMKKLLDQNLPLINFKMSEDERKLMSSYQFFTVKPMIIVLNLDEDKAADNSMVEAVVEKYKNYGVKVMQVSAKIEAELSSLEPDEQEAFLKDLNIKDSALNRLSQLYYEVLGLISFFTVGTDEVRAWAVRRNSFASQAAGVIHSDLQRGFIRAEIMKCEELLAAGGEIKLKEEGKFMLKGKDYIVEDGDIMHVRFNV